MQVLAAVCAEPRAQFEVLPVELAQPNEGEVLVKLVATGLCHTDIAVRDGEMPMPMPAVLGHEGAGIVVGGAKSPQLPPGTPVVMSFAHCGECRACLSGQPSSCEEFLKRNFAGHRPDGSCCHTHLGRPLHGAFFGQSSFATHALVEERHLVPVPADLPLELLAPLGCGLMTGAGAVMNWMRPRHGDSLVVFGLGAVGMAALMAARIEGCNPLIAVDVQPARLALARELGATHTIDARDGQVAEQVRALTGGRGADCMVEAIGNPALLNGCFEALRSRGTAALLGAPRAGQNVSISSTLLMRGLTIKSVVEGDAVPRVFIPRLIDLHRRGLFPFEKLLRHYPFSQINTAVAAMESGAVIKPVLTFTETAG
ncbi:MAG: NAD(P)-dependent alcohol dehydrogenase, partial [Comamonadaceae bacterium]